MTTEQQYKALAAMLPKKLEFRCEISEFALFRIDRPFRQEVLQSELLGLCHEIEEGLTAIKFDNYIEELKKINQRLITKLGMSAKCVHASAERRIEALAKVKGLKI